MSEEEKIKEEQEESIEDTSPEAVLGNIAALQASTIEAKAHDDEEDNVNVKASEEAAAKVDEENAGAENAEAQDDVPESFSMNLDAFDEFDAAPKKSSLKSRIISGVILAPAILYMVISGGVWYIGLMGVTAFIACAEWVKIVKPLQYNYMHAIIGASYLSVFLYAALVVRMGIEQGAWLTFVLLFAVWGSDIGAYVFGKTFKGKKLAPKISPNKTRAGLYGAMFSAAVVLLLFFALTNLFSGIMETDIGLKTEHTLWIFVVGCFIGLIGQVGDLFVSMYKRKSGLKDTGQLIPGHGGLLDRIDALILVCPCYLGIVWLWLH